MAVTKVGIYRQYFGPIPADDQGRPLPRSQWMKKRQFSWLVRWYGDEGRRYSKSFDTQARAQRFAEAKQREVRHNRADPPPEITLGQFRNEHRELMSGNLAPSTLKMQLKELSRLEESLGRQRLILRITSRDIERYLAGRRATGISAASANRELRTLRRIFNLAISRGYLSAESNPCVGVPMLRITPQRPEYVSPADFTIIYGRAQSPLWRALLVTIYTTGLRLREAMHLLWSEIDFEKGQLHVTRKTAGAYVQAWAPKDKEMRTIPLPKQAVDLLAAWQASAPEGCPYVFMEPARWEYYRQAVDVGQWRGGRDLTNNILRRFQTLCRRGGVKEYSIHDLRRSCITNWAKALPIHVVQQLAGHSDIKTTQQYYLSVQASDISLAQAVQRQLLKDLPTEGLANAPAPTCARVFPGKQANQPIEEAPS